MIKNRKYLKVAGYEGRRREVSKVVLLYSGGLDTSVMIKWIKEKYRAKVIALTIDIGQITDNLKNVRKKALKIGAAKAIVIDAKTEFAYKYIAKGIKANASYQGRYYLSTPLGRPLLAKWAVKIAAREGADAIAHGCTGKGNDQVRIEATALALNPDIKIIAPVREWGMGRDQLLSYAKRNNIAIRQTESKPYSYDDNMWGVTGEGGEIENPSKIPPLEEILLLSRLPEKGVNKKEIIEIDFIKGIPVTLNGKETNLVDLIARLNKIGARHGIGVAHHIEDRVVGLKVRGIYEAPAAEIIITAHKDLEKYVSTRLENEFKTIVDTKWAYLCYGGLWHEPLIKNLSAYINRANRKTTGKVKVLLYKGRTEVIAIETPNTIFEEKLATFTSSEAFNQNASAGFIELYSLQMRLAQQNEKTVLLSVGSRENKLKLKSEMRKLADLGYKIYATYKTHKFLLRNGMEAVLVYKISEPSKKPNLSDLLAQNRFDLIINILSDKKKTKTDGKIIRKFAIKTKTHLITDIEVAKDLVEKLVKSKEVK